MARQFVITIIVALTLLHATRSSLIKATNWCSQPYCKKLNYHTICKWGISCGPDKKCQTTVDFNIDAKNYIMELHNEKRNKIALGQEAKVPQNVRKAGDMNALQWDIYLEFVARCHSRQCDKRHDDCRRTPRFADVGQNIYTVKYPKNEAANVEAKTIAKQAVEAWYDEVGHVDEDVFEKWDVTEKASDRFTQLIWSKTSHVGCGLSEKHNLDDTIEYFLVCNYAPEGNVKDQPIYEAEEPCSKCPKGETCNANFKGLCGTIKSYPLKCPCEE